MKIDTEHMHHWMNAIRESTDHKRTLEAFWRGQMLSKEWLIETITPMIVEEVTVDVHAGWFGTLASMIFCSDIPVKSIQSIDKDPDCQLIAEKMNRMETDSKRFRAITKDITRFHSYADVIINTSCEHLSQETYDLWLSQLPEKSMLVLQSTNYEIDEHIRTATSVRDFSEQSHIKVLWEGELVLPKYSRYMLIGTQ